jgi:hypothetical protein
VANNIKLIEDYIKQSLKQIAVNADESAEAWQNFEKKYSTITVMQQATSKSKAVKNDNQTELNISKSGAKWIYLGMVVTVLLIASYFAWPYLASLNTTEVPKIDSSLIVKPQPAIIPPKTISPIDTIKKDTLKTLPTQTLIAPNNPNNVVPSTTTSVPPSNTTVRPIINRPKKETPTNTETTPKEEKKEEKKSEGEFDFFDKPSGGDSLRLRNLY